jgi:hypothetical protein
MTATDPTLAARIAELGVPLSADYAPQPTPRWQQLRTDLIRTFRDYMPETAATKAVDKLDEVIAEALLKGTAEIRRLKAERDALQERLETVRAVCDAADHAGVTSGGWFTVDAVRKAVGGGEPR